MNPKVKTVRAKSGYRLELEFSNGEWREFDLSPYLDRGVFRALRDPARFIAARAVAGSIELSDEVDLSYDTVYLEGKPMASATRAA